MGKLRVVCLLAAVSCALVAAAAAGAEPDQVRIDSLVRKLGSDDFGAREGADRDLLAIGGPALKALRQAQKGNDAEVARRAGRLITRIHGRIRAAVPALVERWGGRVLIDSGHVAWVLLAETPVTDDDLVYLGPLDHLDRLDLSGTRITDTGLEHVAGLTTLTELNLNGCIPLQPEPAVETVSDRCRKQ